MPESYVPRQGDIVWLQFTPQAGHEQSGLRPAMVVSPRAYNSKVGLALFCPITSRVKGYPFEVLLPSGLSVQGAILADQIKSLDCRVREANLLCVAPPEILEEVMAKIFALLEGE